MYLKQRWLEELVNNKSSLKHYAKFKINPGLENYLLDRRGFYGASMKFKLRSNTLKYTNFIDFIYISLTFQEKKTP